MHVQRQQIHDIAERAHAAGKVGHAGRPVGVSFARNVSRHRLSPHRRDGRRHRSDDRVPRRERRAPAAQDSLRNQGAAAAAGFPDSGLRPHPAQELSDADLAVLERVSVSLRVLRHPQSLRPAAAAQDRRSRSPPSSMPCAGRRGIRRWSISSTTISSAIARPPRTCCRTSSPGRSSTAIPCSFACEATLNIAKQPEILALMREVVVPRPVRRHRDAGGRCAQGDAQGPEQRRADDGVDQDAERLRPGGHVRHHPRPRHRFRRYRGAAQGLHRGLAHPDADHQSAAGVAEDAAVGPAQSGGPAGGRSDARKQRSLPAPLRRGGVDVAALHRLCQRSGAAVRALPPSGRVRPMSTG